ncbi:MAG: hypothetical protein JOY54_19000 [Acidobacteriaceae bacterium]|nr:hypothetical protein [Acidobacteriaceae bacterium]
MLPLSLLAATKISNLLTSSNALQEQISSLASSAQSDIPVINSTHVVLSSASPDLADMNAQLGYPRVCLYCNAIQNKQSEKFRSFSGTIAAVAEVWASANLVTQVDQWIHFYVEALTELLRAQRGDWGDGFFFSGKYDVQFQPPKSGGLGFVQSAKVTCTFNVSIT